MSTRKSDFGLMTETTADGREVVHLGFVVYDENENLVLLCDPATPYPYGTIGPAERGLYREARCPVCLALAQVYEDAAHNLLPGQ